MRPCVVVCVLLCGAAGVCAQSSPAFEAVSVKPSPPWQPGLKAGVTFDETHFSAHFMTMQSLIIVWPQIAGLVSAMILLFALGYVVFQRQEVRA